jgi:hypothetical protein
MLAVAAQGATINYTVTGTLDVEGPQNFELTFSLDLNPVPSIYGVGGFGFEPPNIPATAVLVNGVSYDPTVTGMAFLNSDAYPYPMLLIAFVAAGFSCDSSDECQAAMYGPKLYTGPENAPTLLTGAFPATGLIGYVYDGDNTYLLTSGMVDAEFATPEPGTIGLLLMGASALALGFRKR